MKKVASVLAVVVMVVALVSLVFAASPIKGTIKSIDAKAGMVVFAKEGGTDEHVKVDKSVDLSKVKDGDKVEVTLDKGVITGIKAAAAPAPAAKPKAKAAVGC